jgi:hypothetical protein
MNAGGPHTCVIKQTAAVECWGDATGEYQTVPAPSGLGPVVQISTTNLHVCVLKADGTVFCWGTNDRSQLNVPAGLNLGATPAQATQNLIATIGTLGLPAAVANSLSAPLNNIDTSNLTASCGKLDAFINQVDAKVKNGQLMTSDANQLFQAANAIKGSLGCA